MGWEMGGRTNPRCEAATICGGRPELFPWQTTPIAASLDLSASDGYGWRRNVSSVWAKIIHAHIFLPARSSGGGSCKHETGHLICCVKPSGRFACGGLPDYRSSFTKEPTDNARHPRHPKRRSLAKAGHPRRFVDARTVSPGDGYHGTYGAKMALSTAGAAARQNRAEGLLPFRVRVRLDCVLRARRATGRENPFTRLDPGTTK
jgi:hypothetical protein